MDGRSSYRHRSRSVYNTRLATDAVYICAFLHKQTYKAQFVNEVHVASALA